MKKTKYNKQINIFNIVIITLLVLAFCFVARLNIFAKKTDKSHTLSNESIINSSKEFFYTGEYIEPKFDVLCGGNELEEYKDYVVSYKYNILPGTGYAVVSGIGDYTGDVFITYSIIIGDEVCDDFENGDLVRCVYDWYSYSLVGRKATREEIIYWVHAIKENRFNPSELLDNLFADPQFIANSALNSEIVNRAYRAFLGRKIDSSSQKFWCEQLDNEEITKYDFYYCIVASPEFINNLALYTNHSLALEEETDDIASIDIDDSDITDMDDL